VNGRFAIFGSIENGPNVDWQVLATKGLKPHVSSQGAAQGIQWSQLGGKAKVSYCAIFKLSSRHKSELGMWWQIGRVVRKWKFMALL